MARPRMPSAPVTRMRMSVPGRHVAVQCSHSADELIVRDAISEPHADGAPTISLRPPVEIDWLVFSPDQDAIGVVVLVRAVRSIFEHCEPSGTVHRIDETGVAPLE